MPPVTSLFGDTKRLAEAMSKKPDDATASRSAKVAASLAIGAAAYGLGNSIYEQITGYRSKKHFFVYLPTNDEIFDNVSRALLGAADNEKKRALQVRTVRNNEKRYSGQVREALAQSRRAHGRSAPSPLEMLTTYDSETEQKFLINGHRIGVTIDSGSGSKKSIDPNQSSGSLMKPPRMVFRCTSEAAQVAVMRFLNEMTETFQDEVTGNRLFTAASWGEWRRFPASSRPLDTVVLQDGVKEELIQDLERFLSLEEHYGRLGLPWHRGYMFHGPPGTGKTSIAKAVAQHFGLDVYYLPLADLNKDSDFADFLRSVSDRGVLLLEDIDVLHATDDRDADSGEGLTLQGLLNALDGVITPHGLITMYTTNDLTTLDPALRRTGRTDKTIFLDYLVPEQAERLIELVTGMRPSIDHVPYNMSPSDLIEAMKGHLDDPEAAYKAGLHALSERTHTDVR